LAGAELGLDSAFESTALDLTPVFEAAALDLAPVFEATAVGILSAAGVGSGVGEADVRSVVGEGVG